MPAGLGFGGGEGPEVRAVGATGGPGAVERIRQRGRRAGAGVYKAEGPEFGEELRAINPGNNLLSRNLTSNYHWRLRA